jgi:phospholipase C
MLPFFWRQQMESAMAIEDIDHFVVLMLENRSFDHMFGLRPDVSGIGGTVPAHFANPGPHGTVRPAGGAPFAIPTKHGLGPFHNLVDVNEQLFGSKTPAAGAAASMKGFVASYVEALKSDTRGNFGDRDVAVVMQSFDPGSLPAITALADEFVLCDHWFSEVPGPTHPNRLYVHAGTSSGFVHNVFKRPFDIVTIYELLQRNGNSWATYDFDLNEVKMFTRIGDSLDNFKRFSPSFGQDVETGTLPNYSFIIPRFSSTHHAEANDQHAPHDVRWGDDLIADVYDTLRSNEAVWRKSALIVTYDEHGGFFDHVVPPAAINPDGIDSPRPDDNFHNARPPAFKFDRLGVRVPALIASPWVKRGQVVNDHLQHTSILRTVRDRFGITTFLGEREKNAPSLAAIFANPLRANVPQKLPRPQNMEPLPPPDHHANPGNQWADELQRELLEGTFRATRVSHPEDDETPPQSPTVQAEVSRMAHRRWSRHEKWMS